MGLLPTAVTVVTAGRAGRPAGATANAVGSLSLEPMLMLACLDLGSRTLVAVQAAPLRRQRAGRRAGGAGPAFSTKAPVDKWEGVGWTERAGIPTIDGSFVWRRLRAPRRASPAATT